jgi:beta-lactamase class A
MEEEKQIEMMKTLQIAVNSSDNFVEDLLIESIWYPAKKFYRSSDKYGEMKVNYQGSIIAQAVMEYKGRARKIFIDGLVKVR